MANKKGLSPALLALTASALSLPGLATSQEPDDVTVDYRYSKYSEGYISASKTFLGESSERYEIDTHQFSVNTLIGSDYELGVDLTLESMSGASPWFVTPGANNEPLQVMSGATIEEDRSDVELTATRYFDLSKMAVSAGYSTEDDYDAINVGLSGQWELTDTVSTISAGVGYSDDRIKPESGTTPINVERADRDATTAFIGYGRVLGPNTAIQTSISVTSHDGYLSDPYKQAVIQSPATIVADNRPNSRTQRVWLTRFRQYFNAASAALHLDYRLYDDSWDVTAHTLEMSYHQKLPMNFTVSPGVRWYSQSEAFFHENFYATERDDGLASSDYRLSAFGALSFSLEVKKQFDSWSMGMHAESYRSGDSYAHDKPDVENPGLVDYDILSVSLKKAF